MRNQKIILDNKGHGTSIKIPPGFKALKIIRFEASGDFSFEQSLGKIELRTNLVNTPIPISLDQSICQVENGGLIFPLNQIVPIIKETSFKFRHMETLGYDGKLTLFYELLEIPEIPLSNPEEEFQAHLENYDNAKIVFSAPFGSGKSYFLDYFFSKKETEYEVFKVYPVNYSVASNEDIFKYVKADLLFQLMGKDVEFENEGITFFQAVQEYVYLNPFKTLSNFVEHVSKLHPKTELIAKSVNALKSFLTPFVDKIREYQTSEEIDDKKKSLDFIQELYEYEGSLYEDNIYTQIIRQLLERLKESHAKESVLVIEDLDRMDPDHVFRILNVISAHYDTFKYGISQEDVNAHNKFGFDKIIVVCDVKNIKAIFEHRYGEKADFAGYFNKFFSSTIFEFDNKLHVRFAVEKYFKEIARKDNNPQINYLIKLLRFFLENEKISLREIISISNIPFNSYDKHTYGFSSFLNKGPFTRPLLFLIKILEPQNLISKIERIKNTLKYHDNQYTNEAKLLMASLAFEHEGEYASFIKDSKLKFKYDVDPESRLIRNVRDIQSFNANSNEANQLMTFTILDFLYLLIENINRISSELEKSKHF